MCLAVPLKLIEIKGKEAVGESLGMRRAVRDAFWLFSDCRSESE